MTCGLFRWPLVSCIDEGLIQSPIRSRRGFSEGSWSLSRINASGLRSPTKRSVLANEGRAASANGVLARATGMWEPPRSPSGNPVAGSPDVGVTCRHRFYGRVSVPAACMDIGNVPFVAGRSDMLAEPESYFATGGSQRAR